MDVQVYVEQVLEDESLTAGLDEPEAEVLVAWAVKQIEDAEKVNANMDVAVAQTKAAARKVARAVCGKPDATMAVLPKNADTPAKRLQFWLKTL